MCETLCEVELPVEPTAMPPRIAEFVAEGLLRSKSIRCFDFVPSNPDVLHAVLAGLRRGRFCEWGSGIGIGVGIAEMLGYRAVGFEIDEPLAEASRNLLADFGLRSEIVTGDYYQHSCQAEVYFAYAWPSEVQNIRHYFAAREDTDARLLICAGADDIRCEMLRPS